MSKSEEYSVGCATHPSDAPHIQGNEWLRMHYTTGILWCATHPSDAPRIRACEFQTINQTAVFLCQISLPLFHSAPLRQNSSRGLTPPFFTSREIFGLFRVVRVLWSWFLHILRGIRRQKDERSKISALKCLLRVFHSFFSSFLVSLWFLLLVWR